MGSASPCPHCSHPQLMFSTCLAGALLFDPALQVFPALTSVPLQNTQPLQAWEGWSPSRSLPCLTGPSPLQIKNVYLIFFFFNETKTPSHTVREALRQQTNMSVMLSFKRAGRTSLCLIK